jgi:hypothetical protein
MRLFMANTESVSAGRGFLDCQPWRRLPGLKGGGENGQRFGLARRWLVFCPRLIARPLPFFGSDFGLARAMSAPS